MNDNKHNMTFDSIEAYLSKSESIVILKDTIVSLATCDVFITLWNE